MYKLVLWNTTSKQEFAYKVDKVSEDTVFSQFKIKLDLQTPRGEYEYKLYSGEEVISKGLLRIGDYKRDSPEININNTFKQYGS